MLNSKALIFPLQGRNIGLKRI